MLGINGLKIIETEMVGEQYEDWSDVRSHGRAARRRKKHRQRIVIRRRANGQTYHDKLNGVIYMHPADAVKLRQAIPAVERPYGMNPW